MAVNNESSFFRVTGDGVTVSYSFPFKIFTGSDVALFTISGGIYTPLVSGFTITPNASTNGGTVLLTVPIANGVDLYGELALTYTQPTTIPNGQEFDERKFEAMVDRAVILTKQVRQNALLSLKLPKGESTNTVLPVASVRANKVAAFDASGNLTVSNSTLSALESTDVSAQAAAISAASALDSKNTSTANALAALNAKTAAELAASGMKWRPSVQAATVAPLPGVGYLNGASGVGATLTAVSNGAFPTIDGIPAVLGNRYLIKNEVATNTNGVYLLTTLGTAGTQFVLTRAVDADQWDELVSQVISVEDGTVNADAIFICTVNKGGTLGATAVTWSALSVAIPTGSLLPEKFTDQTVFTHGQCRLSLSAGNLLLGRYNGKSLIINGSSRTIPAALLLAATGVLANTVYYICAFMNAGVMTLEYSTTGHATDTATGVEIKSGDATRTLVGMAWASANNTWGTGAGDIANWFNPRPVNLTGAFSTGGVSTGSTSSTEISTSIRVPFLSFAGVAACAFSGAAQNGSAGAVTYTQLNLNGTTTFAANSFGMISSASGGSSQNASVSSSVNVPEARNYITMFGSVSSGSGSWFGPTTAAGMGVLSVTVVI